MFSNFSLFQLLKAQSLKIIRDWTGPDYLWGGYILKNPLSSMVILLH